jgi:hypothetical protein
MHGHISTYPEVGIINITPHTCEFTQTNLRYIFYDRGIRREPMTTAEPAEKPVDSESKRRVNPKSVLMRGKFMRQRPKRLRRWDEYEVVK